MFSLSVERQPDNAAVSWKIAIRNHSVSVRPPWPTPVQRKDGMHISMIEAEVEATLYRIKIRIIKCLLVCTPFILYYLSGSCVLFSWQCILVVSLHLSLCVSITHNWACLLLLQSTLIWCLLYKSNLFIHTVAYVLSFTEMWFLIYY